MFGRHVERRSHRHTGTGFGHVGIRRVFGDAHVENDRCSFGLNDDVVWFQVSVDDALFVDVVQCIRQLLDNWQCFFDGHPTLGYPFIESSSFHQIHHNSHRFSVGLDDDIVDVNKVRMLDATTERCLSDETVYKVWIARQFGIHQLDNNISSSFGKGLNTVTSSIDSPHTTTTQLSKYLVVSDGLTNRLELCDTRQCICRSKRVFVCVSRVVCVVWVAESC